jgi:hypothetical protein
MGDELPASIRLCSGPHTVAIERSLLLEIYQLLFDCRGMAMETLIRDDLMALHQKDRLESIDQTHGKAVQAIARVRSLLSAGPINVKAQDADAIRLAAETLDEHQQECESRVIGEIVEMRYSDEIGTYYGSIRCPRCEGVVHVRPMTDYPKCGCGIEWRFDVEATGTRP